MGSSQRGKDWTRRRLSLKRRTDTWMCERERKEEGYISKERDLGVRMAVIARSIRATRFIGIFLAIFGSDSCAGTVGDDEQKRTN